MESNNYWSSSAHEDSPNKAWNVTLDNGNGNDDNKDNDNFVLAGAEADHERPSVLWL